MALTSVFYDGPNTETDRAKNRAGAPDYGVYGADGFKIITHPSIPYALTVKTGRAHGHGVTDTAATDQVVQCATLSGDGAVRYDLIVVRRNWQPLLGGPSTLVAIAGGSTMPNIQTIRKIGPGLEDDQPIALVEWRGNQNTPFRIIDLRCWAGNGGMIAANVLALDYLARPGADVLIGGTTYRYAPRANDDWGWVDRTGNGPWMDLTLGTTAGVPGVRTSGAWVRVGGSPAQARLVAGGTLIQVRGELAYSNPGTPSYMPAEGWAVASLPASMAVSESAYIVGTSDRYGKAQVYLVNPNRQITIGPGFAGLIAQFNGIAPS